MGTIRLFLAIAVVLTHSSSLFGFYFVGGKLAVEIFYIISGFYMALVLNEKYNKKDSYKLFITNRMLKLYPIYWTVALLTVLLSVVIILNSGGSDWGPLQSYNDYSSEMSFFTLFFLILSNIIIFFQDLVMFLGVNLENGQLFLTSNFWLTKPQLFTFLLVPQAWTISIELTFYLIAPFIARKKLPVILVLIFISAGIKIGLTHLGYVNDPWSYRFFPSELHLFLLGIVAYKVLIKLRDKNIQRNKLLIVLVLNIVIIIFYSQIRNVIGENADIVFITIFFVSIPFIFLLSKNWKLDSKIGELSYPIYISHMFVYYVIFQYDFPLLLNNKGLTISIYSIILSFILNKIIYDKIEKFRQSRVAKMKNTVSVKKVL